MNRDLDHSSRRYRELVRLTDQLSSDLDLETILPRIVEIATRVVGARYGALAVVAADGSVARFVTVGIDPHVEAQMGPGPVGRGLLGLLMTDPRPVRIAQIADDARAGGFPPGHPAMSSFLGVPIGGGARPLGTLYLTESAQGEFSADDEELTVALAATAAVAIANAHLFAEAAFRQRWTSALAGAAHRLLPEPAPGQDDTVDPLVLDAVINLTDAQVAYVAETSATTSELRIEAMVGHLDEWEARTALKLHRRLADDLIASGQGARAWRPASDAVDGGEEGAGAVLLVAMGGAEAPRGLLVVAKAAGHGDFTDLAMEVVQSFAGHLAMAADRREMRSARRRLAVLEDRDRIARDLHDHVIQHLFATGLSLQAMAATAPDPLAQGISEQVREIDAAIGQIRQSIFALRRDDGLPALGVRARINEVVARLRADPNDGPTLRVRYLGPVDLMADPDLTDDLTAVVTEALTNSVRHAQAGRIDLTVEAADGRLRIEVLDDGRGIGHWELGHGVMNLQARADARQGDFSLITGPSGGTRLTWSVAVPTLGATGARVAWPGRPLGSAS